jgi:hypothetical protein
VLFVSGSAAAGHVARIDAKVTVVFELVGKATVTRYFGFALDVTERPSSSKYNSCPDPNTIPNWIDVVTVVGVALISEIIAAKMPTASVWPIEARWV